MEQPFVILDRLESGAGFIETPEGQRPYLWLDMWTTPATAAATRQPRLRLSVDQALKLSNHIQMAVAALVEHGEPPSRPS